MKMNEQRRCETCKHWKSDPPKWGICRWAQTTKWPEWMVIYPEHPVRIDGAEGEHCRAWEAYHGPITGTDNHDIIGGLIGEGEPANVFGPEAPVWSEMAVRAAVLRGYEAGKAEAAAEIERLRKAVEWYDKWLGKYLSGQALPPGDEYDP